MLWLFMWYQNYSHFLNAITNFIGLKIRTKLTSPKKLLQQQKLSIAKLKTTKPNQLVLLKTNNMAL